MMDSVLRHYSFPKHMNLPHPPSTMDMLEGIRVKIITLTDEAIVGAIIKEAYNEGITDLYMIDRDFIMRAISNELERMKTNEY